jgi:hypothetical protein
MVFRFVLLSDLRLLYNLRGQTRWLVALIFVDMHRPNYTFYQQIISRMTSVIQFWIHFKIQICCQIPIKFPKMFFNNHLNLLCPTYVWNSLETAPVTVPNVTRQHTMCRIYVYVHHRRNAGWIRLDYKRLYSQISTLSGFSWWCSPIASEEDHNVIVCVGP